MTGRTLTRILLVRHAHTEAVGHRLLGRGPCPGVSQRGADQAAALAELLAAEPLAAVYSSPALRTRQTAARIAEPHGLTPAECTDFAEVDFGEWTGRTFEELARDPTWRDYNTMRSVTRIPSGEMMLDVQARAVRGLLALAQQHAGERVVVVSHADVIRGAIGFILGMPVDNLLRLAIEPASISTLEFQGSWPQLRSLCRTA